MRRPALASQHEESDGRRFVALGRWVVPWLSRPVPADRRSVHVAARGSGDLHAKGFSRRMSRDERVDVGVKSEESGSAGASRKPNDVLPKPTESEHQLA